MRLYKVLDKSLIGTEAMYRCTLARTTRKKRKEKKGSRMSEEKGIGGNRRRAISATKLN